MNAFILSTALTFGQPIAEVYPDRDAPRYIAKALYKQQGWDKIVSKWEKKHLKLDEYPELAYIGIVGQIVVEKRISHTWEF